MKKLSALLVGILTISVGFGQILETSESSSTSTKPKKDGAITGVKTNAPTGKSTTGTTISASSAGASLSLPSSPPSGATFYDPSSSLHPNCPSHAITKQHVEEDLGISWEEFQAQKAAGIAEANASSTALKTSGVNEIAVIFHVIHNTDNPAENVPYSDILDMFNDLQEDYQLLNTDAGTARSSFGFTPWDADINFCLATFDPSDGSALVEPGVVRVETTEDWFDGDAGETNDMKFDVSGGDNAWDRDDYLNVWICDITNGATSGVAGYAYLPTPSILPTASIDGIVVDYNLGVYNDNILTHEVGHYLGLEHTWGAGGCVADDGFSDTPITTGPSSNYSASCSGFQETCSGIQTQYENYMDYSNCTCMFTEEQSNYMLSILQGIRSSLLLSPGCDPVDAPPNSAFSSIPISAVIIPEGGGVSFIDESTNAPTIWTWEISGTEGTDWNWTGGSTASDQNPTAEFYNVGFYDVTLTAENAFGPDASPAIEIGYVEVVAAATGIGCDTLRNYDPTTEGMAVYILSFPGFSDWGYLPAHSAYDFGGATGVQPVTRYADRYVATSSTEVRRLRVPFFQADDLSGGGEVRYQVLNDDTGAPGTLIVEDTVAIADLAAGFWNILDFSSPPTVTGAFWIAFEFDYGSPQDTAMLACVNFTDRAATTGLNTMFMETDGAWYEPTALYAAGWTTSLYIDVLTSNGSDPVADFSFSEDEICEGGDVVVSGSASTNVTDYEWWLTDDPATTLFEQDFNPSYTFGGISPSGDYLMWLWADGACKTDLITVPLTVNPAVSFSTTISNTTCGLNNGEILISGEGGGDGSYEYSLDGTTWTTDPLFDNLPSGDYTVYVRTAGDNCMTTALVTVASSTAFIAGIDSDNAICEGEDIDISASGGTSYDWYNSGTSIGSSATINVSPTITTTYNCIVTDALGCESNVFITINVNPLDDASFDFFDFCFGASNSATSIATAGGTFTFFDDPSGTASIDPSTGEISGETLGITYTVQYDVSDVCPNSSTETVTVNAVDDPSFITDDFCDGDVNAVTSIATPGGVFTYDGSDGSSIDPSTGVITGGEVGTTYSLTYETPPGVCSATSSPVTVTVFANPTIDGVSVTDPLCNGESTGAIDIDVSASSPTYDWGAEGSSEDLSGLTAGSYTVVVTDGICSTTDSYTLTDPALLIMDSVTTTHVLCNGETTGTAEAFASGGTPGITYDFGGADETALGAGLYTATATDANGCLVTQDFTINEPTAISGSGTATMDDGTASGSIDFTPGGGVAPYTFDWSPGGETTEDLTDLEAGTYTVTVTDANGCTETFDFHVDSSVGIDDETLNNELSIYPNPTQGMVTIQLTGDYDFSIRDARGRLILVKTSSETTEIDLSDYESGVYFIRVHQDGASLVKKLVLK